MVKVCGFPADFPLKPTLHIQWFLQKNVSNVPGRRSPEYSSQRSRQWKSWERLFPWCLRISMWVLIKLQKTYRKIYRESRSHRTKSVNQYFSQYFNHIPPAENENESKKWEILKILPSILHQPSIFCSFPWFVLHRTPTKAAAPFTKKKGKTWALCSGQWGQKFGPTILGEFKKDRCITPPNSINSAALWFWGKSDSSDSSDSCVFRPWCSAQLQGKQRHCDLSVDFPSGKQKLEFDHLDLLGTSIWVSNGHWPELLRNQNRLRLGLSKLHTTETHRKENLKTSKAKAWCGDTIRQYGMSISAPFLIRKNPLLWKASVIFRGFFYSAGCQCQPDFTLYVTE